MEMKDSQQEMLYSLLWSWGLLRGRKECVVDRKELGWSLQDFSGIYRLGGVKGNLPWEIPVLIFERRNVTLGRTEKSLSSMNSSKLNGQLAKTYITDNAEGNVPFFHVLLCCECIDLRFEPLHLRQKYDTTHPTFDINLNRVSVWGSLQRNWQLKLHLYSWTTSHMTQRGWVQVGLLRERKG